MSFTCQKSVSRAGIDGLAPTNTDITCNQSYTIHTPKISVLVQEKNININLSLNIHSPFNTIFYIPSEQRYDDGLCTERAFDEP